MGSKRDYVNSPKFPVPTVARKLGVSKQTVYREVEDGNIDHHNVRGQIRISEDQMNDYLGRNVSEGDRSRDRIN